MKIEHLTYTDLFDRFDGETVDYETLVSILNHKRCRCPSYEGEAGDLRRYEALAAPGADADARGYITVFIHKDDDQEEEI